LPVLPPMIDLMPCLACLSPVSFVPNVASVSGLPIHDFPFGFLQRLSNSQNLRYQRGNQNP
jgi:hypothetical protein